MLTRSFFLRSLFFIGVTILDLYSSFTLLFSHAYASGAPPLERKVEENYANPSKVLDVGPEEGKGATTEGERQCPLSGNAQEGLGDGEKKEHVGRRGRCADCTIQQPWKDFPKPLQCEICRSWVAGLGGYGGHRFCQLFKGGPNWVAGLCAIGTGIAGNKIPPMCSDACS
ncbi:hypothetical protein [Pasteuria penetrans]|uniref:hypothetical protein n=1 Tax=Pasteuria penetrans TaxID=86005 RepID=UPI000FB01B86|nr:hypothetical protein [Pasteuria penetrans]